MAFFLFQFSFVENEHCTVVSAYLPNGYIPIFGGQGFNLLLFTHLQTSSSTIGFALPGISLITCEFPN